MTKNKFDIIAIILIVVAITLPSIAPLSSGDKVNFNDDFFLYAGKHEAVRKAILEYHVFPTRSFWFAGGYPTLGDPEDPSLNPFTLITLIFGSVKGLKVISFLSMLIGGLSTYALARYVLNYTQWGSLFSGLIFGLSLFLPMRIKDGNYNEVYSAFLPLCLLLIGLACRGKKIVLPLLVFVFYVMLSDGKQQALMAILFMMILCACDVIPIFNTFGQSNLSSQRSGSSSRLMEEQIPNKINIKPLKVIIFALLATFFVGMMRFLPAFDLIASHGGLGHMHIYNNPQTYTPEHIFAYTYQQLWKGIIGWSNILEEVTIGWLPVFLSLIVFFKFCRQSFPWAVNLLLFGWLILAYNAPVDLLKLLWNLPIFNAINKPYKYFSFPIVFVFTIVAGQVFWLLKKMQPKWLEHVFAVVLIFGGISFLYPRVDFIQKDTYTFDMPAELLVKQTAYYNIQGKDISRIRKEPLNSLAYTNLMRGIGTIDINVAFIIDESAVPKYFIDAKGNYILNDRYKGEAFFLNSNNSAQVHFQPNSIIIQVQLHKPDILIINQNYHRDWHTDHGMIFEQSGLIALKLEETGTYNITMHYINRSFYIGLIISILSLISLIFISWSYKTRRLTSWSRNLPVSIRWLPRFILWLID
jgi:hypothetical protein